MVVAIKLISLPGNLEAEFYLRLTYEVWCSICALGNFIENGCNMMLSVCSKEPCLLTYQTGWMSVPSVLPSLFPPYVWWPYRSVEILSSDAFSTWQSAPSPPPPPLSFIHFKIKKRIFLHRHHEWSVSVRFFSRSTKKNNAKIFCAFPKVWNIKSCKTWWKWAYLEKNFVKIKVLG